MRPIAIAAFGSAALILAAGPAAANPLFDRLSGSWSGNGRVSLGNGSTERVSCRAYYNKRGSSGLGIAIRCASPSYKIDLRSTLSSSGSSVSGSWEERQFNASGSVSGSSTASRLSLSISGAVSGSMSVNVGGSSQSVSISTGGALAGVSISLSKT